MSLKEQVYLIIKDNENLSGLEVSKILNIARSTANQYIKKLGFIRDREKLRKLNNTNRSFKINISSSLNQIFLGSILGDGYISINQRVINSKLNLNSQLVIKHGIKQEEYVLYKRDLLLKENIKVRLSYIKPKIKSHTIKERVIKDNGAVEISTQKNIVFNKYRNNFYYNNIKIIHSTIYELEALGLAIWYMDDGTKHISSYYLHTECFTLEEHYILIDMLLRNFNIKAKAHKVTNKYFLYITVGSKNRFTELIKPFICESMKYKLHI